MKLPKLKYFGVSGTPQKHVWWDESQWKFRIFVLWLPSFRKCELFSRVVGPVGQESKLLNVFLRSIRIFSTMHDSQPNISRFWSQNNPLICVSELHKCVDGANSRLRNGWMLGQEWTNLYGITTEDKVTGVSLHRTSPFPISEPLKSVFYVAHKDHATDFNAPKL